MPVSSVRLSEGIKRAAKLGGYNISERSREGIEQAVIGDLVGVCWICGEGIHRRERRDWISSRDFLKSVARGQTRQEWPVGLREYRRLVDFEQERGQDDASQDIYFMRVGKWLNLPEHRPVEFCSSCSEYIDQVRERSIQPSDIPIPYQYRVGADDTEDYLLHHVENARPRPDLAYAAESIAVYLADYVSLQRSLFGGETVDSETRRKGEFWWATRGRADRIVGTDRHPWLEIALRSHAECLRTNRPLREIYNSALNAAKESKEWYPGGSSSPPGLESESKGTADGEHECGACGTELGANPFADERADRYGYCGACLFSYVPCNGENECSVLHPRIRREPLEEAELELYCYQCGRSEDPPKGYAEILIDKIESILREVSMTVPKAEY